MVTSDLKFCVYNFRTKEVQAARCTRRGGAARLGLAVFAEHLHEHAPVGELRGHLDRFGDTADRVALEHYAVDDDVDEVLDLLVEHDRLAVELLHFAVDADAREALLLQILEELRELALAADDDRCHDERLRAFADREDLIGHLIGRLLLDLAAALGTMGHAHAGEQQTQIVVDLGRGAHGGAGVLARGLLVDRDRRRKPVDAVEVGLVHLAEKLTGVARQALDVAALPLGVHGVERQGAFSGTRQSRDHNELVTRNGQVDIFEVVLASTLDDD